jgi:biotin operon repressor
MKADRLLSILLLQTRDQVPAAELAERLEVSVRTVMRDVEALSAAGVPVYTVRGPHGGIALLPGYRTDVTGLTADEARALFVLLSDGAHADLGLGQAFGSALRKLMAALPAPHRPGADLASRRILIDPARWAAGTPRRPPTYRCSSRQSSPTGGCDCGTGTAATARSAPTPSIPTASSTRPAPGTWSPITAAPPDSSAPTESCPQASSTNQSSAARASNSPTSGNPYVNASTTSRPRSTSPSRSHAASSASSCESIKPTSPARHPPKCQTPPNSRTQSRSRWLSLPWARPRYCSVSLPTPKSLLRPNFAKYSPAKQPKPPRSTPRDQLAEGWQPDGFDHGPKTVQKHSVVLGTSRVI